MENNIQKLLEKRYFLRDKNTGELIEHTPEEMFDRVAIHISKAESKDKRDYWKNKFFDFMNNRYLMPNSPTLMNAGKNKCLSACSVLGRIPDSLEDIYKYIWYNAKLTKYGCGVGQDLSAIRPKGEIIKSSGGKSAGVINWMKLIQAAADTTRQGDTARRAANMVTLRFNHPDIFDFITSKKNNDKFNAMNISVTITDEEFEKALNKEEIWLEWNNKKYKKVNADKILDVIIENAWYDAEPGLLFLDKINKYNPFNLQDGNFDETNKHYMITTNPCGEQCLEDFEFCNLLSINLEKIYNEQNNNIDTELLKEMIYVGIRMLDDIIDVNEYVLPQFKEKVLNNRKIGLGVTGFANLLIKLGIKYDSEECLRFIDDLFGFIKKEAEYYNQQLAKEKGVFPAWNESIFAKQNKKRRNATLTTQAPTGSISTILGTQSYGIEPLFAIGYKRRIVDNEINEINELFKQMLHKEINDEIKEQEIIDECCKYGTANLDCVPQKLRELFRCANDISYEWHVRVLARIQKYIDNAVSKTVNLPENTTKEDVKNVYELAFKLGCKGITIYRNNSRKNQTFQIGEEKNSLQNNNLERGILIQCSDDLIGKKRKLITGCGSLHVNAYFDPITGELMEVFLSKGSTGGCIAYMNALSRQISSGLRSGQVFEVVIDQLNSITPCPSYIRRTVLHKDTSKGSSCPNALGYALVNMQNEIYDELGIEKQDNKIKKVPQKTLQKINNEILKCPECGELLRTVEGCNVCTCGYSACS